VKKDTKSTNTIIAGHLLTTVILLKKEKGITKREMQAQKDTKRSTIRDQGLEIRLRGEKRKPQWQEKRWSESNRKKEGEAIDIPHQGLIPGREGIKRRSHLNVRLLLYL
jgi:hypothetical protein